MSLTYWILAARPKTLLASVCPVVVGSVLAMMHGVFHPLSAVFALFGSMAIQVGTNFANDYFDFKKGADTAERLGPQRMTQAGLISPQAMKVAFIVMFIIAAFFGGYLMMRGGLPLVLIGIFSILFGLLYTGGPYPLGYNGLGEVFAFVFFGPVAVAGTYYVQALTCPTEVLWMGVPSGLFSVMLILVNNIRDVAQDRVAGKKTIVVRWGTALARGLYVLCAIGAGIVPLLLYPTNKYWLFLPVVMVLELQRIFPVLFLQEGSALNAVLAKTARLHLSYVVVLSVILWKISH